MEGPTVAETKRFNDELGGAIHLSDDVLRIPSLSETCAAVATCPQLGVILAKVTDARCDGYGGVDIFYHEIEDQLLGTSPSELTRVCVPHLRRLGFKCKLFIPAYTDVPFSVSFAPMGCERIHFRVTDYCRRHLVQMNATSPGALRLRAILRLSVRFVAWKNRAKVSNLCRTRIYTGTNSSTPAGEDNSGALLLLVRVRRKETMRTRWQVGKARQDRVRGRVHRRPQ
jgi:hypothetical protein